jgi:hypothetical protein
MKKVSGEKRWSSKGETKKTGFPVVPSDQYTVKLQGAKAEVRKPNRPGSMPWVSCPLVGEYDGRKFYLFPYIGVSMKPWKNGVIPTETDKGLRGLVKALGGNLDAGLITLKDENGQEVECVDPKAVVQFLKNHDGEELQVQVKLINRKDKDGKETNEKTNEVSYFIEKPGEEEAGPDDEEELKLADEDEDEEESDDDADEEDDEEAEEEEEDEDSDEDEDDEDEEPAKPAKKAAKPVKKAKKR